MRKISEKTSKTPNGCERPLAPRGAAEGRAIGDRGCCESQVLVRRLRDFAKRAPVFACRAARGAAWGGGGRHREIPAGASGPPASLRRHCAEKGVRAELGTEPVAIRRIAGLCGAAGHSKAGVFSAKAAGVGPQEGLAKFGPFRRGLAKGAQPSWLRSLPTFCRITESRSPRGLSGGEEKIIFSPRGLGPDGGLGGFVPGPGRPLPIPGGNATEDRMHGNCCSAERASRSRSVNSRYRCPPSS